MKFINLKTGVIVEPNNEMVIAQMRKSADFKVFEKTEEVKEETKVEKETKEEPKKKRK